MTATVRVPRHKLTVVDFQRLGAAGVLSGSERVELIDGELMDMAPVSSLHADYVDRLAQILTIQNCGDYRVRVQNPVRLDDDSEVAPDLALVVNRSYRDAHPTAGDVLLLIEVADAAAAYDRELKIPLYARNGIPEVWMLDATEGRVSCYREPMLGSYRENRTAEPDETLTLARLPEVRVHLAALWR
ncbi:MAG: Uma2 family endonuclease [Candidatus Competibacter sp.]|nr:Uma2 family endonuclease [Candidatus Competibacter sp.]MDG4584234.1 Uma2 family endonuclease [Candidatus Competibacter sp.]